MFYPTIKSKQQFHWRRKKQLAAKINRLADFIYNGSHAIAKSKQTADITISGIENNVWENRWHALLIHAKSIMFDLIRKHLYCCWYLILYNIIYRCRRFLQLFSKCAFLFKSYIDFYPIHMQSHTGHGKPKIVFVPIHRNKVAQPINLISTFQWKKTHTHISS